MRGKLRLLGTVVLLFPLLGMAGRAVAQAPGWTLQTVVADSGVGDCPVAHLDAQGNASILYFNGTLKSLFFVKFDGATWSAPVEVDQARAGHMLCSGGMAMQSTGKPAVVYVTDDNHLFYAPMTGAAFQPQEIVLPLTGAMHSPNLVLGPGDSPLIVYVQNTFLIYVTPTASGWTYEQPAKNAAGDKVLVGPHSPVNILRDSQGNLHLSYYCMMLHPWYLTRAPGGFVLPVRLDINTMNVDDTRPSIALALDSGQEPHVSATVGVTPQLKLYSRACAGTTCTWSGQVIDQLPDSAATSELSGARMVYDPQNHPVLSYYYRDATGVAGPRLLRFNGNTWSKTTVDQRVDYGRRAWLALNAAGQARVSYYAGGLVYAAEGTAPVYWMHFPVVRR